MKVSTACRALVNRTLMPFNLKLETRRAEQFERDRVATLLTKGYFDRPAFPIPRCMRERTFELIPALAQKYRRDLSQLNSARSNSSKFCEDNDYFSPPDSDVLYVLVRELRPSKIIEIGSGNSTRLIRQAIDDGDLETHLISIDPKPRVDIEGLALDTRLKRIEHLDAETLAQELKSGDFLFIDTTHRVGIGNDVVFEFLQILPLITSGVIIHFHDIALPYDYPPHWVAREASIATYGEQYILQAILSFSESFEVLWPGYYVQQAIGSQRMDEWFPARRGRDATSFWIRKCSQTIADTDLGNGY